MDIRHAERLHCSLGQISEAFFEVGGQNRRTV